MNAATQICERHTNCSLNQQTHPRAVHFFSWRAFLVPPGSSVASFLDQFRQFFSSHLQFFLPSVNSFWSHCRQFLVPPSIMADTFLCQKKFEFSLSAFGQYKQEGIFLFKLKSFENGVVEKKLTVWREDCVFCVSQISFQNVVYRNKCQIWVLTKRTNNWQNKHMYVPSSKYCLKLSKMRSKTDHWAAEELNSWQKAKSGKQTNTPHIRPPVSN